MAWLGLDDTDSLDGGCTTEMFLRLLQRLGAKYRDQRLVRLWPFAANRTRGNAAVAAELLMTFDVARELLDEQWEWLCQRSEEGSEPAMVLTENQLDESLYWNAVRNNVDASELMITSKHQIWSNGGSGIIGATAAIAWRGEHDHTWENTVYRMEENIGKRRVIDEELVAKMDELFPLTFLNRDPRKHKGLIAPRSPCPVLLGIRGENIDQVEAAYEWLHSNAAIEEASANMIWRTNQACDDHLESAITATVQSYPDVRNRGHSSLVTSEGRIVAFAEGGKVNKLLQKLIPGDIISWMGLEHEGTYHLERLCLLEPSLRSKQRPICNCGKRMKSSGKNQPPRCPSCGTLSESNWVGEEIAPISWVEPPPDRRRHLAAPLQRKIPDLG